MKRASWLLAALVAAMLVLPAGAARASCEEAIPLPQALSAAHAVFVGTVTGLDYQDRVATVAVDEVWKGSVGAEVTVSGGGGIGYLEQARAQGDMSFTSVDRTYAHGERYLFVTYAGEGSAFMDNQCSNTQLYERRLDAFRPADARVVEPPGNGLDSGWVGLGAAAGLGVALTLLVLIRRQRVAGDLAPEA